MLLRKLGVVAAMSVLAWGCSDDGEKTTEPVAVDGEAGKSPDAPGLGTDGATDAAGQATDQVAGGDTMNQDQTAPAAGADSAPAGMGAGSEELVVKASALNVRKGPGTKHSVVRTLKKGTKVQAMGCAKNWCKIGEGEYVSKKHLK